MKKSNRYFIDLFAGCGGMSLGLEQAGFIPLLYNEINESAAMTYKKNVENKYDNEPIYIQDIKDLTKEVILTHRRKWKKIECVVILKSFWEK